MLPQPIKTFIEIFSKFPSIGPRLATRLAFYLANIGKNEIENLEMAVSNLKKLKTCERCFLFIRIIAPFVRIKTETKRQSLLLKKKRI